MLQYRKTVEVDSVGVFFRKSKKVGKNTRVNVSKSGVGVSTGANGARVGANKDGTYIAGGKDGIRYRKKLSSKDQSEESTSTVGTVFQLIKAIIQVGFYGFILYLIIRFIILILK